MPARIAPSTVTATATRTTTGGSSVIVVDSHTGSILPLNVNVPRGINSWVKLTYLRPGTDFAVVSLTFNSDGSLMQGTWRYPLREMNAFPNAKVVLIP